jgi:hypothetical protein
LPYPFEYISQGKELLATKGKGISVDEVTNVHVLEQALAVRAYILIMETAQAINDSKEPQKVKDNELFARMKLDMIKAHMEYTTLYLFRT